MDTFIKKLKQQEGFRRLSGVSAEVIRQAEEKLRLKFSEEYKEFLLFCGAAVANGHEYVGLGSSNRLNVVENTFTERNINPKVPKELYVVEQTNIDDIVIWQSWTGEVFKTMLDEGPEKLCNSLSEYIDLE